MKRTYLLLALLAGVAAPAAAQSVAATGPVEETKPDADDGRDQLSIGIAGAYLPDYDGSNDYKVRPVPIIRGRLKGIEFNTRGSHLFVDLLSHKSGHFELTAGPIVGIEDNRKGHVKDRIVNLLAHKKTAIEVGGFAGVAYHGLTNPYDSLSLRVDATHDVGKAHKSTIISPTLEFSTPLSHKTFVGVTASMDFVQDKYAQYYFGITPSDSLASGLPTFTAKGGLKDWKLGVLASQSLTGDLRHGLSLFGLANYSHLQGDFKRSPIVSQRGSASQWIGAAGLAYSF